MLVSRLSLQSYPKLAGNNNPRFFLTRDERNMYFTPDTTETGEMCAIGGNPTLYGADSTEALWTVEQYNGENWVVVPMDPNFALIITNDGLRAVSRAGSGTYLLKFVGVKIKETQLSTSYANQITWTDKDFVNSALDDIIIDSLSTESINSTFNFTRDFTWRQNLSNGGLQFVLTLSNTTQGLRNGVYVEDYTVGCIGLYVEDPDNAATPILFAIANTTQPIPKYTTTAGGAIGNALKLYLNTTLTNLGVVSDMTLLPESSGSLPEVVTEDELSNYWPGVQSPYNAFVVSNLKNTNIPALALRKGNPSTEEVEWVYLTPSDDTYTVEDASLWNAGAKDYMLVAWDSELGEYVPCSPTTGMQKVMGIKISNTIHYAGDLTNTSPSWIYSIGESLSSDANRGSGYKIGDLLQYTYRGLDAESDSVVVTFTVKVVDVDLSGSVLSVYFTPYSNPSGSMGAPNGPVVMTTPGALSYVTESVTNTGHGLQLCFNSVSIASDTRIDWNFADDWINQPLYAGENGTLTTTESEIFVGWCTAYNAVKLALDLRNEASYLNYGTTRYATANEVSDVTTNGPAQDSTAVTPVQLQNNYIQRTLVAGNPGESVSNTIEVDTHVKFNTAVYGKGIDPTKLTSYVSDPTLADKVSFWGWSYRALYGDLAEFYRADKQYSPGTLITIGDGRAEITQAYEECNGIVSTAPGYELGNRESKLDLPIALVGKVPVRFAHDCKPVFGARVYLSKTSPGKASTVPYGKCLGKIIDKNTNLDQLDTIVCSVRISF